MTIIQGAWACVGVMVLLTVWVIKLELER